MSWQTVQRIFDKRWDVEIWHRGQKQIWSYSPMVALVCAHPYYLSIAFIQALYDFLYDRGCVTPYILGNMKRVGPYGIGGYGTIRCFSFRHLLV